MFDFHLWHDHDRLDNKITLDLFRDVNLGILMVGLTGHGRSAHIQGRRTGTAAATESITGAGAVECNPHALAPHAVRAPRVRQHQMQEAHLQSLVLVAAISFANAGAINSATTGGTSRSDLGAASTQRTKVEAAEMRGIVAGHCSWAFPVIVRHCGHVHMNSQVRMAP